jgi:hypothetical protein
MACYTVNDWQQQLSVQVKLVPMQRCNTAWSLVHLNVSTNAGQVPLGGCLLL